MARRDLASEIYKVAEGWKAACLVNDHSIFTPGRERWTPRNITALRSAFTDNPLQGTLSFDEKFQQQLQDQPPDVKLLAAEMLWVLFLFARRALSPERKRELITKVGAWSGRPIDPASYYLSDAILAGIGNAGTAFNTQRDHELEGLIDAVLALKGVGRKLEQMPPDAAAELLDGVPKAVRRNIRNILLHLLYPEDFERIASSSHKQRIVRAFARLLPEGERPASKPMTAVDRQLRMIRSRLEEENPGQPVDFFESPFREQWIEPKETAGGSSGSPGQPAAPRLTKDEVRAGVYMTEILVRLMERSDATPELILAAFLAIADHERYRSPSAADLRQAMAEMLRERGRPAGVPPEVALLHGLQPPALSDIPAELEPGGKVAAILESADRFRATVARVTWPLSPRHVLAVLLAPGPHSAADALTSFGFDPRALRETLFSSVEARGLDEDSAAWRRLLQLDPPPPDVPFYAGFSADAIPSEDGTAIRPEDDRLDVMKDVQALCEVLAAEKTDPPLAVGLFGDWGTGKSFFMELMRQQIAKLGSENPDFYCERVVQVWFNAWHYMDTNLWASLAARVFEEMAEQLEKWKEPEQRQSLFDQFQESRGVLAEAIHEHADAKVRLQLIQDEFAAKQGSITATAATAWRAATAALSEDDEVKQKLSDAREKLGLNEAQAVVSAATEQARQFRSLGGRALAMARAIVRQPRFLAFGIVAFAAITGGMYWLLAQQADWSAVKSIVTAVATGILAATAAVSPVLKQASRAIGWIEEVAALLQRSREAEQRAAEQAVNRDLARLEEREREARAHVDQLAREIEEMRAGRRLQRFILERHASAEYRQHLGLVNLIRNDFEQLSTLLATARKERREARNGNGAAPAPAPAAGGDAKQTAPPLPRIDRIVLYIDDLDRCPEDRVVEVLQAVHLLLAFPLFVVVVGVDSRWLMLSLEDHYAALRGRTGEARENGKTGDTEWNTTPQNYLEKIFQIPFTLRPMESAGFGKLVDALLPAGADGNAPGEAVTAIGHEAPDGSAAPAPSDASPGIDDDFEAEDPFPDSLEPFGRDEAGPIPTPPGAKAPDPPPDPAPVPVAPKPNPQGLTVEQRERDFVALLHPLIASPRALKRFTNIYRFLRVQQRGAALARFRGSDGQPGEFQVVALLLAVVVGYPAEAPRLLRQVLTLPGTPWWTLVDEMEEPADAAAEHTEGGGGHGRATLRQALLKVKGASNIADHPPGRWVHWAAEVARFSFQSGRILSLRDRSPGEAPRVSA
ncbi:MAG TPA: P-loop NTPase fold protein [Longimicrobium sp.]|nr:P-loop NTPase fold protein [Longimicrobium sp.]